MRMGDQVRDLKFGRVEEGDQGRVLWMGFLGNTEPTELKVHRYKNKYIKNWETFPVCLVRIVGCKVTLMRKGLFFLYEEIRKNLFMRKSFLRYDFTLILS